MRFAAQALIAPRHGPRRADPRLDGAEHEVRGRRTAATASSVRPSSARTGRCSRYGDIEPAARAEGDLMAADAAKPKLAVWKFASCDGCQLSLLDFEDELLALPERIEIAHFLEATSAVVEGPYDLSLVEGSITTPARRRADPRGARAVSRRLVTIGACATAGGIQALRNFADVEEFTRAVYATPGVHLDARDLDADRRARPGRLRAARLPGRPPPAARGDLAPSSPSASPAIPDAQRLRRVQAARQRLRDGRPRHALPRARSPTPAAARSARPTTAAATAASARWRRRTPRR